MGASVTNPCVVCGRPTPDGYACVAETERACQQLTEIAELVPAARDVMYRQTSTSGSHSPPGPRDLLDYGAGARLDAVQTALTGWARIVADERGAAVWVAVNGDIIGQAANWLAGQLVWLRHKEFVDDVLREVGDCAHTMRGIVATPAGRVYLGPCGADRLRASIVGDQWESELVVCDGDVYGRPGAATGRCRACGTDYEQEPLREKLDDMVRQRAYRASDLKDAYGLNPATVRKWAERELITACDRDDQGRPLYRLGDVLDVAASETARREAARSKRERRKAAREAEAAVTPG